MSNIAKQILEYDKERPFYTFEFFPQERIRQGFENLVNRISRLSSLNPLAVSVTWGAGGSTKDRSLELAGLLQSNGINTILHLTCTNMEMGLIDDVLKTVKSQGIRNILALRGDPPRGAEEWVASDPRFTRAVDLVSYIRSIPEYSNWFCIGVAGYPDGQTDSNTDENAEIERLKEKVDAGADFIITQIFYDTNHFVRWYKKIRAKGITVPIIPGIMPIQTYSSFSRVTKLCGARVPEITSNHLSGISHDDQLVKDYGVELGVQMIKQLLSEVGIRGYHFCTLNLEKSVQRVLESLQWTLHSSTVKNKLIVDRETIPGTPTHTHIKNESAHLISPSRAANKATEGLSSLAVVESLEAGSGELNNAATWDEFPNGRFGDFKSPAFGSQDLWGGSSISRQEALDHWGNPTTKDDLTRLFLDYLHSKSPTTPFSPDPLSSESASILPHLEKMTLQGWWTVGSQPAVDAVSSSDPLVGWGPKAGYVFQKCFVEFFCDETDVLNLIKKINEEGAGWIHYFATRNEGECLSNVPADGRNAVTWGVFPGQEIVQTTIIERESFLSWKEEAFSIWSEWSSFYHPDSKERKLLEEVRDKRWLVSLVHHNYKDAAALWTFMLGQRESPDAPALST